MDRRASGWSWTLWAFVAVVTIIPAAGLVIYLTRPGPQAEADTLSAAPETPGTVPVEVIHPEKGKLPRTTHQPGTVQAFNQARLYAEVPGYLKTETVDIGDHVTKGQLLIEINVPELVKKR